MKWFPFVSQVILDSERSDECIDFTMMCVIFLSNAPISNFGGGFRCKSEYPWCILEIKSKHFPTFKFLRNLSKTRKFASNFEDEKS
ncbi:Uncharacterized protein FWK35_00034536 [Aphis craccivora]|uniref:Uncharacterized protein n=1 Tax=Aphis craccivora TaxID=307492 RepID=A0A6G0W342_APHCR|nr:Uncharacterized protein FWK35_00034536 [Aphis craccivora]